MLSKLGILDPRHACRQGRRRGRWALLGCALALALVLKVTAPPAQAAAEEGALVCEDIPNRVIVTVENMRNLDGLLTVELYDDNPDTFIKKAGRLERYRLDATESEGEICVIAPGPGTYAIVLYHDENGNKKFDKNFLGIPKEGFGVSNNPGFSLGPPKHEDAAFFLDGEPVSLSISVNYL